MTRLAYLPWNPGPEKQLMLQQATGILKEYAGKYVLTLRGLYYQMVARGFIENSGQSYSKLGDVISRGRLAGFIDWEALEDRGRQLYGYHTYEHPAEAFKAAREKYRRDLWAKQRFRPEVWVEKEALVGIIAPICQEFRVNYFGCRGYNSQSEQWRAGQRFASYVQKGQVPIVFHLGDHDPSGIDMTRDNRERLAMFAGVNVTVVRLALNYEQIEQHRPPPNPAKLDDPRADAYIAEFGDSSWELDALRPEVLHDLIGKELYKLRDEHLWNASLEEEAADLEQLDDAIREMGGLDQEPPEEDDRSGWEDDR